MWTQRQVPSLAALGEPLVLLGRGERGQRRSREVRSWERNQDLHVQRRRAWALGWGPRTIQCFQVTLQHPALNETRGSMRNRPLLLITDPRWGLSQRELQFV